MIVGERIVFGWNDGNLNFIGGLTTFVFLLFLCFWREIAEYILEMFLDQAQE